MFTVYLQGGWDKKTGTSPEAPICPLSFHQDSITATRTGCWRRLATQIGAIRLSIFYYHVAVAAAWAEGCKVSADRKVRTPHVFGAN